MNCLDQGGDFPMAAIFFGLSTIVTDLDVWPVLVLVDSI